MNRFDGNEGTHREKECFLGWVRLLSGWKNRGAIPSGAAALALILALAALAMPAHAKPNAYVFNVGSGTISVIDTDSQIVINTVTTDLKIRWFSSRFYDGRHVWAVDGNMKKAEVIVFNPQTFETVKRISIGKGPSFSVELTPDRQFAIAHAAGNDEVVVIDAKSYEIVRRVPVGRFPCDLTLSADGRLAYEPDRDQDTVSIVDWKMGKTLRTVSFGTGSKPHMLTLSPDGKRLWVQERESATVSVYDTTSLKRLAALPVGNKPATNEFTPSGRYTLVTHIGDKIVKVFESETFREVKTLNVGKSPVNSVFRPDGRYAYVTNRGSNTVSVIDTNLWDVVKTLDVGKAPFGIYIFDPESGEMAGNR